MHVIVLIPSTDETASSGYEWISSGMENELCYDIDCELMHVWNKLAIECHDCCMIALLKLLQHYTELLCSYM